MSFKKQMMHRQRLRRGIMDETEKKFQQFLSTQVTVREKQDHLGVLVSSLSVNVVWN